MKYAIFLSVLSLANASNAFAVSYACVTSREVPTVAFEYDDGGDRAGETDEVQRWETKDPRGNALALVKGHPDEEFPVDQSKIKKTHLFKGKQLLGAPLKVLVKRENSSEALLDVPYISPGHGMDTRVTARGLVFDGKTVKSVDYNMCGQD